MTKIAEPLVPSYRGPVDAGAIVADLATRDALYPLYGQRCVVLSNQTEYQWDGSTWVIPSTGGGGAPTLQDVTSQGNTTTDDLIIGGLDIIDTSQPPVLRLSRNQNIGSTSWAGESLGDIEWYTNDPSRAGVYARIRAVGGPLSGTPNAGYPDGHLVFETDGQQGGALSEKMRITDRGRVGIGTTSPSTKLHVVGNGITNEAPGNAVINIDRGDNPAYSSMLSWRTGNSPKWYAGLTDTGDNSDYTGYDFIIGQTKGSPSIFIDTSDNVGIGTTSPSSLLEISATEQGIIEYNRNGDLEIYNSDSDGGVMINGVASEAGDLYVSNAGNVGIGTTLPLDKLHVEGNIRVRDQVYARDRLVVGPVPLGTKSATIGGNMNFDTIAEPTGAMMGNMTATTQSVAGNIEPGTYYYAIMFVDADGAETGQCATPYPSAVVTDSATGGQILLQNIPISPDERVTQRKIYRTQGYGSQYASRYLATINDNDTTTSWTDNYSNSALDPSTNNYRKRNTTAGLIYRDNSLLAQAPNTFYTSFGSRALEDVTTGQDNVAIGGEALRQVTTATQNTAVGGLAGVHTTTAGQNTYIGYVTGYLDTGSGNTYVGAYAGRILSSAYTYANTYIGQSAGYKGGDNDKCVAVGQRAGGGVTGSINIMLGWQAGYKHSPANGGSYNIYLGSQAGRANTGNGNIIIGTLQEAYDPGDNDQLNIGGLIWGTELSRSIDVSVGKVGIRLNNPQFELDVNGRINCDQGFYQNGSLIQLPRVYSTYEDITRDTTHTFYIENYQGGAATGHYDHTLGATFINVSVRRG